MLIRQYKGQEDMFYAVSMVTLDAERQSALLGESSQRITHSCRCWRNGHTASRKISRRPGQKPRIQEYPPRHKARRHLGGAYQRK